MQFLNIFYNVLMQPAQEFRVISMGPVPKEKLLVYATIIICFISAIGGLLSSAPSSVGEGVLRVFVAVVVGIIFWLYTTTVFSTAAYIFSGRGRPQTLLILTAFAVLPWIFMPVFLLLEDSLGILGNTIAILGLLGIWLWSSILFLMALKYTYDLTLERVILVAGLPFLMTLIGLSWVCGFFVNLYQFFS